LYGVASGDPLANQVILWTHAKFSNSAMDVTLRYQVASDAAFTQIVSQGDVVAKSETGFTAKADATGLMAGTSYFYRFVNGADTSPVGRTRTLPTTASSLKLAVMSCTNYPTGFFNVYSEVANSDAEYALHLGDYIYEYASTGYASSSAATLGRVSAPVNELLSLADYRTRHAQYKSDPDSKNLHSLKPMIAVWDDHEFANNAFKDGAENHPPATAPRRRPRRRRQAHHLHHRPARDPHPPGSCVRTQPAGEGVRGLDEQEVASGGENEEGGWPGRPHPPPSPPLLLSPSSSHTRPTTPGAAAVASSSAAVASHSSSTASPNEASPHAHASPGRLPHQGGRVTSLAWVTGASPCQV
jgi:hypothetical protein